MTGAKEAKFKSDIYDWISKVGVRLQGTPKGAIIQLMDDMRRPIAQGGNMPVKTGNLRNSLEIRFNSMPPANKKFDRNNIYTNPRNHIINTISKMQLGQKVYLGFRANYAYYMELKHGFVRLAAQNWVTIVTNQVRTYK